MTSKVKISILVFLALGLGMQAFAQEDGDKNSPVNKKGHYILPQAGDFSIGVDAVPYLNYLGGVIGGSGSLSITDANIFGRYYLADDAAVRANIYINNDNKISKAYDGTDKNEHLSTTIVKSNTYGIMGGYQMFRGYRRLRGFYGAQLGISRDRNRVVFKDIKDSKNNTKTMDRATTNLVLGAFAGVEYYFAPKMCIGAEVNLSAAFSWTGATKTVTNDKTITGTDKDFEIRLNTFGHGKDFAKNVFTTGTQGEIPAATVYLMFSF